jgi:PAS domain S-box-containing protein
MKTTGPPFQDRSHSERQSPHPNIENSPPGSQVKSSELADMLHALIDQGAVLEILLNQIAHGVLVCNAQREILFSNATARHLITPYLDSISTAPAASAQGRICYPTGKEMPLGDRTLSRALQGETIRDREERIVRPDGSYSDILTSGTPVWDADQQLMGAVLICMDITERKRAEQTIRQTNEDLNRAQAVAHTGSWRLDVQRNELIWSDETHRMFGIPKGAPLTYETFLASVHPDDRDFVDRAWRAALEGESYEIEHRIVVGETIKWVRERAELEFDAQGTLRGGFGTVQDITAWKRAEEQIQSVARFPSENPNPVLRVSNQGVIIYANEASALVQSAWASEAGDTSPRPWREIVSEVARSGQSQDLELNCEGITFLLQFVPVVGSDYVNIYACDITERKRAEDQLRYQAMLLDNVSDVVYSTDLTFRIVSWNKVAEQRYGWTAEEIEGKILSDVVKTEYPSSSIEEKRRQTLEDGEWQGELIRTRKDGVQLVVQASTKMLWGRDGKPTGTVTIERDITDRKQAEQRNLELTAERERARILTDFVQSVSHDFKTPLATINSCLYLLDRLPDSEKRQHQVAVMRKQTQRLANLLECLLTMIRLERDTYLNFQPVNLNTLLGGIHTYIHAAAEQKGVRLRLNQSQEALWVTADAQELERALRELAKNAVQFTPDGGTVAFSVFLQDDMAVIEVQDSGIGIEEEVFPHIFKHLYRGDSARSAESGGLGLGLPIAQKIVQLHRGRLEVSSTLGKGATFQVWLPLNSEQDDITP